MMKHPPDLSQDPAWLEEISTVRKSGDKNPTTPALPKIPPATGTPLVQTRPIMGWNTHQPIPIITNTAQCIYGATQGLDKTTLKHLTEGRIRPTAVVDLHGLGEGDAWLEMVDFLHDAAAKDHRCALIIHGKGQGYGPNRDMGVIKFQIAIWLAGHPKVLAFHTALPQDGGAGAIYVYLKRHI